MRPRRREPNGRSFYGLDYDGDPVGTTNEWRRITGATWGLPDDTGPDDTRPLWHIMADRLVYLLLVMAPVTLAAWGVQAWLG